MARMKTFFRNASLAAALLCGTAQAQVSIGAGGTLALGGGTLSTGCADVTVAGTSTLASGILIGVRNLVVSAGGLLDAGSGVIGISGDFGQFGTFTPGTSRFASSDGCGSVSTTLSGSSAFYDFAVTTAGGRSLIFPPALTQNVVHALTLSGSAGNLLAIRSVNAGQAGLLDLAAGGTQSIAYVDVKDNHATGQPLAHGAPTSFNSVDSGDSNGWFLNAITTMATAVPVPMLGVAGLILLGLFAGLVAMRILAVVSRQDGCCSR